MYNNVILINIIHHSVLEYIPNESLCNDADTVVRTWYKIQIPNLLYDYYNIKTYTVAGFIFFLMSNSVHPQKKKKN